MAGSGVVVMMFLEATVQGVMLTLHYRTFPVVSYPLLLFLSEEASPGGCGCGPSQGLLPGVHTRVETT